MILKKFFNFKIVAIFAIWFFSIIFLFPGTASALDATCPNLFPGDMIKITGKPAIYILNDELKYLYFPDGDVFKSWNKDESYGIYYTVISQACFDSLSQPTTAPFHVSYRSGSYLVKSPSSDNLFVVGLGNKLHPITVAAAKDIFGNNYTYKTIGLSEWPFYTKEPNTITKATFYPGMIARVGGSIYFVDEGYILRILSPLGFEANRFKHAFVRELPSNMSEDFPKGGTIDSEINTLTKRINYSSQNIQITPTTSIKQPFSFSTDLKANYDAGYSINFQGMASNSNGVSRIEIREILKPSPNASWLTLNTCYNINSCSAHMVAPNDGVTTNERFIQIKACDKFNNCEESLVYSTIIKPVKNYPTSFSGNLNSSYNAGENLDFHGSAFDNNGIDRIEIYDSINPAMSANWILENICYNTNYCSGGIQAPRYNSATNHYFKMKVCDKLGNCEFSGVYSTVINPIINYPTSFYPTLKPSYNPGERMIIYVTVVDDNGISSIEIYDSFNPTSDAAWGLANTCYNTNSCNGGIIVPERNNAETHYFKIKACDNLGNCEVSPIYTTIINAVAVPNPPMPIIEVSPVINFPLGDGREIKTYLPNNSQMYSFQMFKSVDNINFDQVTQCRDTTSCSFNEILNNSIRYYYYKSRVCDYSGSCTNSNVNIMSN